VHASDITRQRLARLPWDYRYYGLASDDQEVVPAVRASMSIPFFFDPVIVDAQAADIDVPLPDGSAVRQHYEAGCVTWIDGGMLRNFPIGAFDRADAGPPRWPTIGVKLSSLRTLFPAMESCDSAMDVALATVRTLVSEWDSYALDESTAARTIFVDNAELKATQFDLTRLQQDQLFLNGVHAATQFIIEMSHAGGVPKTGEQAQQLVTARRAASGPG
jgi:NTE family protein